MFLRNYLSLDPNTHLVEGSFTLWKIRGSLGNRSTNDIHYPLFKRHSASSIPNAYSNSFICDAFPPRNKTSLEALEGLHGLEGRQDELEPTATCLGWSIYDVDFGHVFQAARISAFNLYVYDEGRSELVGSGVPDELSVDVRRSP